MCPYADTFECDYRREPWAYQCLDRWHIEGQHLRGYHSIPFRVFVKEKNNAIAVSQV